jgi:hypothetical protein
MWNWLNCYLSGRHEFGVSCAPGTIFLRCVHCGRRSPGWAVDAKTFPAARLGGASPVGPMVTASQVATATRRGVPFERVALR